LKKFAFFPSSIETISFYVVSIVYIGIIIKSNYFLKASILEFGHYSRDEIFLNFQ